MEWSSGIRSSGINAFRNVSHRLKNVAEDVRTNISNVASKAALTMFKKVKVSYPFCVIIIAGHGELNTTTKKAPYNICIKQNSSFGCIAYTMQGVTTDIISNIVNSTIRPIGSSHTECFLRTIFEIEKTHFINTGFETYEAWHKHWAINTGKSADPTYIRDPTQVSPIIGCIPNNNRYPNKTFVFADDLMSRGDIETSGIIVGDNNLNIPVGTILTDLLSSERRKCTTEEIINYFKTKYFGVNPDAQLFIYDTTCSTLSSSVSERRSASAIKRANKTGNTKGDILRKQTTSPDNYVGRLFSKVNIPDPIIRKPTHIYYIIPYEEDGNIKYCYWDSHTENVLLSKPKPNDREEIIILEPNYEKRGRNWGLIVYNNKSDEIIINSSIHPAKRKASARVSNSSSHSSSRSTKRNRKSEGGNHKTRKNKK